MPISIIERKSSSIYYEIKQDHDLVNKSTLNEIACKYITENLGKEIKGELGFFSIAQ